jgi:hypothetical protein
VLDFGRLIASGETASVLRDQQVIRAYLGTEELGAEELSTEELVTGEQS